MSALVNLGFGFALVWLVALVALFATVGAAHARQWLAIKAEVRAFEREFEALTRDRGA